MEIIKTRDANVDEAKIKRDKKIQEALSAYVVNKVSGYRIASDALDVLLVSLPTLRPLVSAVWRRRKERRKQVEKHQKKPEPNPERQGIVGSKRHNGERGQRNI